MLLLGTYICEELAFTEKIQEGGRQKLIFIKNL
jgi:hypothetical protein